MIGVAIFATLHDIINYEWAN